MGVPSGNPSAVVYLIVVLGFFGLAVLRPHHPRSGALAARARVRRGRAVPRARVARRIWFTELLPNLWAPILVYTTLILPTNVGAEAALSFLGVGVKAPTPTLGNILTDSVTFLSADPTYFVLPGLFIFAFVLSCNLLGDGLRDALDPKADRH